jgi:hypothetical protein
VSYFHSIERFARSLLTWASLVILLAMIASHVGLVDVGQWTDDEFLIIGSYRDRGWAAFCGRLISWSPRPISEGLIWAYSCLVNWAHKPFIGAFLGLLWLLLIGTPLISFMQLRTKLSGDSRRTLKFFSLFAFALIALFLLGHSPGELFYWPAGAAAYLTTLSAITLCFFQLAGNLTEHRAGRVITAGSLICCAGSSETGAFFAFAFGCLCLVGMSVDKAKGVDYQWKILWHLVPALIGMSVLGLLAHNRVPGQAPVFATAEYHNLYLSLKAALGETLKAYLTTGHRISTRGVLLAFLLKACFFLVVRYCWLSSGVKVARQQVLIVFALSVVATTYFSVAASYYGYGGLTNPWHEELRQCLIMLLVAAVGLLSCHWHTGMSDIPRWEWLGGIFAVGMLSMVVPGRFRALVHDYKNYAVCIENRNKSWNSGLSDGNTMIWFSPPRGQVAQTLIFVPGIYYANAKDNSYVHINQFFEKERLEIRPYR